MAAPERNGVTEHEVRIAAAPETVYEFLTDPEKVTRWKGRTARLDPRRGGAYRVDINDGNIAVGEFVELDPPRRVVFTWGWEGSEHVPPGSSTVEVTLTADGDGTILRLVHRDLPAAAVPEHADGWKHFLPRLQVAASGGDPGSDQHAG